jgi:hypothetical protein
VIWLIYKGNFYCGEVGYIAFEIIAFFCFVLRKEGVDLWSDSKLWIVPQSKLAPPPRGSTMPEATVNESAGTGAKSRRKWRNRKPLDKRLDLTPEQAEAKAAARKKKQASYFLTVRLTSDDEATIRRRAESYGMSLSEFVRTVVLSGLKEPPPPRTDPAAVRALAFELSKLGTNLNQLARRANEAAKVGSDKELATLQSMETGLRALEAEIAGTLAHVIEL